MKQAALASAIASLICLASATAFAAPPIGQQAAQVTPDMIRTGSDIPAKWNRPEGNFDYVRREVMIPMRDGVKLYTVIIVPKTATPQKTAPILLTRTPYDAKSLTSHADSVHLGPMLQGYDNAVDVIVE